MSTDHDPWHDECRREPDIFERSNPILWALFYAAALLLGLLLPHISSRFQ